MVRPGEPRHDEIHPMKLLLVTLAILTGVALAACAAPEQANCPDKYEGQSVTVSGKITKTASFLGLATLSTLQDAKGGVCVAVTKTSIGNEGDSVRLEGMLAIHNATTILPNVLRRADETIGVGGAGATPVPPEVVMTWPEKFCRATPGMTKDALFALMGAPTNSSPEQASWQAYEVSITAFFKADGTVGQLQDSTGRSHLPCDSVRT
jgi:hypothetical protein